MKEETAIDSSCPIPSSSYGVRIVNMLQFKYMQVLSVQYPVTFCSKVETSSAPIMKGHRPWLIPYLMVIMG